MNTSFGNDVRKHEVRFAIKTAPALHWNLKGNQKEDDDDKDEDEDEDEDDDGDDDKDEDDDLSLPL